MNFAQLLKTKTIIGLSPMDGVTDEPFRLLQCQVAKPDVVFTEFASAEGLTKGGVKLYDLLLYKMVEKPIVAQLFGKDPSSFYKAAVVLCHLGFDGIDINMGCPAKTVVHNGSGAALISKPELASEIITSVKNGVNDWLNKKISIFDIGLNEKTLKVIDRNLKYSGLVAPNDICPTVSVKTRLGIDKPIIDSWLPLLLRHNLDFITVHGRTLKQGYSGLADWDLIAKSVEIAKNSNTLIWGNGDIDSRHKGIEYAKKHGVSGILIGRAAMGNPWLFNDFTPTPKDRFSTMLLHSQVFKEVFGKRNFDCMRKHFLFYSYGLPNAKQLRMKLVHINSIEELLQLEGEFCNC